ncbi:MAG TPA: hypothetical protein HA264_09755 [Methanolinea sp.]|nr:hypothetical protein [Methanolinea sp.]
MMMSEAAADRRPDRARAKGAEYEALGYLLNRGYLAIRAGVSSPLVHLVALKPARGALLIRVVAARRAIYGASHVAALWKEDIGRLRSLPVPADCEVHLWVSTDRKGWHRYRVLPGGIAEAEV